MTIYIPVYLIASLQFIFLAGYLTYIYVAGRRLEKGLDSFKYNSTIEPNSFEDEEQPRETTVKYYLDLIDSNDEE